MKKILTTHSSLPDQIISIAGVILTIAIAAGMLFFATESFVSLIQMDWSESDTYFFLLRRVLSLIIGIELIRFIQTFKIETLLELLIFLLARKILVMEINEDYSSLLNVVFGITLLVLLKIVVHRFYQPENKLPK